MDMALGSLDVMGPSGTAYNGGVSEGGFNS